MAQEVVEVIDSDDHPIGIATRGHMRAHRLPHRCVYILVFDTNGRLLVHQRTPTKDVFPSYWDVAFGGVVDAGEEYAEAAVRELKEEAGLGDAIREIGAVRYEDEATVLAGRIYTCTATGQPRFQAEEVTVARWLSREELADAIATRPFCPDGLKVWEIAAKQVPPRLG